MRISEHDRDISAIFIKLENVINFMKPREAAQAIITNIYVKPNSKEFKIQLEEDNLVVHCQEAPMKGKTNRELIKELSRFFKRKVWIVSGSTSRHKKILIENITREEIKEIFA